VVAMKTENFGMKKLFYPNNLLILLLSAFIWLPGGRNILFSQSNKVNYSVVGDTVFKKFKLEDIAKIREAFEKRKGGTEKYLKRLNESSLDIDSTIINRKKNAVVGQDAILIRLAEFYYEEANDEYWARSAEYDRKLDEYDSLLALYE
jgi:uncharacterized membrane protein